MRVAIIDFYARMWRFECSLAQALAETGCDISIHSGVKQPQRKDEGRDAIARPRCKAVAAFQCSTLRYRFRRALQGIQYKKCMTTLIETLREEQPDIVHFLHSPLPNFDRQLIRTIRVWAPVMLTAHETDLARMGNTGKSQYSGYQYLISQCDRLVTHTTWARRRLIELGVDSERIDLIPFGALDKQHCVDDATARMTSRTSPLTMLAPGGAERYQDIDVLIKAVRRLPNKVRDRCRFVVVGTLGKRLQLMEDICRESGVEHLFKFDVQVCGAPSREDDMGGASVFVFPDRNQLANGVFMKASSYGVPIIIARKELYDALQENGAEAYLVDLSDEMALAATLAQLIAQSGERNAQAACAGAAVNPRPTWESVASRMLLGYQRTLEYNAREERDVRTNAVRGHETLSQRLSRRIDSVRGLGEVNA